MRNFVMSNSVIESLNKLIDKLECKTLLANPFFRFSKPTHEHLRNYRGYDSKYMKLFTFMNLASLPFAYIYSLILNLIFSLLTPWEWIFLSSSFQPEIKVICISQITSRNPSFRSDAVLGDLPRLLEQKLNFSMFYLNSTRVPRLSLMKRLKKQTQNQIHVNSKTLSPCKTLRIFNLYLKESAELLSLFFQDKSLDSKQRFLISAGLHHQLRRATLANYIFLQRMIHVLKSTKASTILMTIEGHGHEAALINLIKLHFSHIKIIGIQHAPIVPSQIGYFRNIELLRSSDLVFCSGQITCSLTTENLYSNCLEAPEVKILGSSKNSLKPENSNDFMVEKENSILLLPEGTNEAIIESVELLNHLSPRYPQLKFILRLHPAAKSFSFRAKFKIDNRFGNVEVSKLTLQQDFLRSKMCIYRSSAAAIESLNFQLIPVHFNSLPSFDLDPILNSQIVHPQFHKSNDFDRIIDDFLLDPSISTKYHKVLSKYFHDYYSPLDFQVMLEGLN
jgi:hypothetical protein